MTLFPPVPAPSTIWTGQTIDGIRFAVDNADSIPPDALRIQRGTFDFPANAVRIMLKKFLAWGGEWFIDIGGCNIDSSE